jgi:hypothetical protein
MTSGNFCALTTDNCTCIALRRASGGTAAPASCAVKGFRVVRDLNLEGGVVPKGATGTVHLVNAYGHMHAWSLWFDDWWPVLRQWNNELILFPDCVDTGLLACLQLTF